MSVLALDIGSRRIGCAVNPLGELILELPTIEYGDPEAALEQIQAFVTEYRIQTIVLGYIRDRALAQDWRSALQPRIPRDGRLVELDETLTTKEAERQLAQEAGPTARQGISRDSDARAARLILEQYVHDSQN